MSKIVNALFGPPPKTPIEQAKDWKKNLAAEGRKIERQITKIQRAEQKTVMSAKQAAKSNDMGAVKILSKEILHARKAVQRMRIAKAHMNSVSMQIQNQISQLKIAGALSKSTEVMRSMNSLMRLTETREVMQAMSAEMTKAGLMDEMISDALDDALDADISESEMDDEVSKVVTEVMQSKLAGTRVQESKLPQAQAQAQAEEEAAADEDDDDLLAKYNALKS